MLLSLLVPLFYIGDKGVKLEEFGFNKLSKKAFLDVLFYIPFLIGIAALAIQFKKASGTKSLIVIMYFFLCLAISAEVYFRGLVQHFLRGKFHIIALVVISSILFACCNVYYLYKITYMKHMLIFIVGSAAFAGVASIVVERKGSIIFTIILNTLYYFMSFNHATSGKKILLGHGVCWAILFVYGLFLLICYMKSTNKNEEIEAPVEEETSEDVEEASTELSAE